MPNRKYELTIKEAVDKWAKNYPKVMTWIAKLQKRDFNAWCLWLYCKNMSKTPDELLALKSGESKEAEYLLDSFVADERIDIPHGIRFNVAAAVKSFYMHNYLDLAKQSGKIEQGKLKPYRKHSKEELLKIYRATQNPRDRALIPFTWSTAIARETLVNLQWNHLDADWEKQEIPHIGISDKLLKGHGHGRYKGVEQHTFLTPEAKRDLLEYKEWLERVKGLKVMPEDHIFVETHPPYKELDYATLSGISIKLAKRSGVPFSWHDARRYVETALEEIRINPNWARKIRGRKVRGEEAPYSRPAIEQLREKYKEAIPLLQFTIETDLSYLKQRQEASERITAKILSNEAFTEEDREAIRRYGLKMGHRREKPKTEHNGGQACEDGVHCEAFEQISETDLLGYLRQGFQIVHKLQDGQLIVKR